MNAKKGSGKRYAAVATLVLVALCIFSGCTKSGQVWGSYRTDKDSDGNYKSVEFAYSKTFYTDDALAAAEDKDDDKNDALLEGWYTEDGDTVTCTYTVQDTDNTRKIKYTFKYNKDADELTMTGHTENEEDIPIEKNEVYRKENQ